MDCDVWIWFPKETLLFIFQSEYYIVGSDRIKAIIGTCVKVEKIAGEWVYRIVNKPMDFNMDDAFPIRESPSASAAHRFMYNNMKIC